MAVVQVFDTPEVVIEATADVGEGPVFDRRTGRLCWVDISQGMIFENDVETGWSTSASLHTAVGAVAPRADRDGFAVAVADGFGFYEGGILTVVDAFLPEPFRRMNDAKCDSRGRLWGGSTHNDFVARGGALHRWDGRGSSTVIASGFTLPNGIGWNADDTVMYLADSMTHQLLRAEYSPDSQTLQFSELTTVVEGLPDGLAVDLDGCVWLAVWGGAAIHRYDPAGNLIGRVPMPVDKPSSCAFDDDGTLFITTASADLSDADRARQPLAGSVFAMSTNTRGVVVHPFGA